MTEHEDGVSVPAGFQRLSSGLYVAGERQEFRRRETWTRADWKAYEKGLRVLASHNLKQMLQCGECGQPLKAEKVDAQSAHLTCSCTIRVFTKAF